MTTAIGKWFPHPRPMAPSILALMAAALLAPPRRGLPWRWLIAGLFLGAAGLTRPVVLGLGSVITEPKHLSSI